MGTSGAAVLTVRDVAGEWEALSGGDAFVVRPDGHVAAVLGAGVSEGEAVAQLEEVVYWGGAPASNTT